MEDLGSSSIDQTINSSDRFKMDTKLVPQNSRNDPKSRASARWVTIEPVVFLAMWYFGSSSWNGQYLQRRIASDDYNYTLPNASNATCVTNTSDPDYIIQQNIQKDVSEWTLYLGMCSSFPSLFTTILFGAFSDVRGRKIALGSTILGCALQCVVNIMVILLHLPVGILLIGSLFIGLSGGYPLLITACMPYIADVTTEEQRTFRTAMIDITLLVAMGSSELAMGYLIDAAGFLVPPIILLVMMIVCLACIFIPNILIETVVRDPKASVSEQIAGIWKGVQMLFQRNTDERRWKLGLLVAMAFVLELVLSGYMTVIVVYALGEPFCLNSIEMGFFLCATLLVHAFCSALAAKFLPHFLSDIWILHICFISLALWMISITLANTLALLYFAVCIGCFGNLAPPVIRSIISKIIDSHEQGVMFSFLLSLLGAAEFIGPMTLSAIYTATVVHQQLTVFYVCASVTAIPIILACIFQIFTWHHRQSYEKETNGQSQKNDKAL